MDFCSLLASIYIVGAYETRPDIMYVQYLDYQTNQIEELYVYTDEYLDCFSVPERGTDDSGGTSTAFDSWLAEYLVNYWARTN